MNKYIVPICDINAGDIWIKTVMARSISECQEKIMEELIDCYDMENNFSNYREFIEFIDSNYDILIGDIKDIDEL